MMKITLTALQEMYGENEKIAVLTCYDASFAALLEAQGVDILLVGDSLGMVLQGHETTLPVSLDDMVYHTTCVARGAKQAFIIGGMPVCGHIGLTPQSVHQIGGYRLQGKEAAAARKLLEDAVALEQAGADMLVLETIPALLAAEITAALSIPTIAIATV